MKWKDVDILKPPNLNNQIWELMRLNEFLTKEIVKCKKKVRIGGANDGFFICYDKKYLAKNGYDFG